MFLFEYMIFILFWQIVTQNSVNAIGNTTKTGNFDHHVQNHNCPSPVSSVSSRTSPPIIEPIDINILPIQPIMNGPTMEKVGFHNYLKVICFAIFLNSLFFLQLLFVLFVTFEKVSSLFAYLFDYLIL